MGLARISIVVEPKESPEKRKLGEITGSTGREGAVAQPIERRGEHQFCQLPTGLIGGTRKVKEAGLLQWIRLTRKK